jgi:uncharacterized repeat protein (TIGR03803 family)
MLSIVEEIEDKSCREREERRTMSKLLTRAIGARLVLAAFCVSASATPAAQAQTSQSGYKERVLYSFPGVVADGIFPYAGVIRDSAGNFYGTTHDGGITNGGYCSTVGCGVVFKVDNTGRATVLYSFTASNQDGAAPEAGLVLDSSGNLYGTTGYGGDQVAPAGIVFKVDPTGQETILHVFEVGNGDGQEPTSTLARDKSGNLFGTTLYGPGFSGSVFKIDANDIYSVLYNFTGKADGGNPYRSRLLWDSLGNLYGLANNGGNLNCNAPTGCGVLFKLTRSGKLTVLHTFQGGKDGANPLGDLVRDKAGNFYGVTQFGGANGNGVVFRLSKTGKETILYTFGAGFDGEPMAGVVLDAAGNIFGTTTFGGIDNRGSVFKLDSDRKRTDMHSFTGGKDGGRPFGELILDPHGTLYGTTVDGGTSQAGVVFEVIP